MLEEKGYLNELGRDLDEFYREVANLKDEADYQALVERLHALIQHEKKLREEHNIGDRFKVIRGELQRLTEEVDKFTAEVGKNESGDTVDQPETLFQKQIVYLYLVNAKGANLSSWNKLLTPDALRDFSINRPAYIDEAGVCELIGNAKQDKLFQGYLEIAVDKDSILSVFSDNEYGRKNRVKLKPGALKFENILSFSHNGKKYRVSSERDNILLKEITS